jgi:hypothetical protein
LFGNATCPISTKDLQAGSEEVPDSENPPR